MISLSFAAIFSFVTLGCSLWCGWKQSFAEKYDDGWLRGAVFFGTAFAVMAITTLVLGYHLDYGQ